MRPLETWKYTAAPPTPISDGPWPVMPCRFAPWQVMQLTLNRFWPAAMSWALVVVSLAPDEAAKAAYAPPIDTSAASRMTPAANLRRRPGRARLRAFGSWALAGPVV